MNKIDEISIREVSCYEKISEVTAGKKVEVVLDPTLLLTKHQWCKRISGIDLPVVDKYIFAYVVAPNDEYLKVVNELSKKTGLKVMTTSAFKMYDNQIISDKFYNPLEFIKLIKNSEYVVTTSFHATVFSIIFNKKFKEFKEFFGMNKYISSALNNRNYLLWIVASFNVICAVHIDYVK